jgi:hypothetical protein
LIHSAGNESQDSIDLQKRDLRERFKQNQTNTHTCIIFIIRQLQNKERFNTNTQTNKQQTPKPHPSLIIIAPTKQQHHHNSSSSSNTHTKETKRLSQLSMQQHCYFMIKHRGSILSISCTHFKQPLQAKFLLLEMSHEWTLDSGMLLSVNSCFAVLFVVFVCLLCIVFANFVVMIVKVVKGEEETEDKTGDVRNASAVKFDGSGVCKLFQTEEHCLSVCRTHKESGGCANIVKRLDVVVFVVIVENGNILLVCVLQKVSFALV